MAQAARLSLRMQKELKLLLTDPPPGATFPSLSPQPSSSSSSSSLAPSLYSIDAQIEGPEGTVYAKGLFKLKIEIPERYPFQPPLMTFATPIYHPNIDNGGRICLDILNLPPKGAWQPSLNISSVITSIGLLLCEPNPDDGLMQEASREYKYNRQAFDQKAISMTEKYAKIGTSEMASEGHGSQNLPKLSMELTEAKDLSTSMNSVHDYTVSSKRLCGVSRKLSLEPSQSDQSRSNGKGANLVPGNFIHEGQKETAELKQRSKVFLSEHSQTCEDLQGNRKKLSLQLSTSILVENSSNMTNVEPNQCSPPSEAKSFLMDPSNPVNSQPNSHPGKSNQPTTNSKGTRLGKELIKSLETSQGTKEDDGELHSLPQQSAMLVHSSVMNQSLPLPRTIGMNERVSHTNVSGEHGIGFTRIKRKKLGLAGRRFPLGELDSNLCPQQGDKENLSPNSSVPLAYLQENPASTSNLSVVTEVDCYDGGGQKPIVYQAYNFFGTERRKPLQPLGQLSKTNCINIQAETQTEYSPKNMGLQHDSHYHEKQQPNDCDEKKVTRIEHLGRMSPSDPVIVSDSEDSEEEQPGTARISLVRRRLPARRKL